MFNIKINTYLVCRFEEYSMEWYATGTWPNLQQMNEYTSHFDEMWSHPVSGAIVFQQ